MAKKSALFLSLLSILAWSGCATLTRSTITNLTPTSMPRNANNLYPISVAFDTRQYTIKEETLQAFVQVGTEEYPMQKTPLVRNRWEGLIPIPKDKDSIFYHIKFTYEFKRIPEARTDSKLSPEYQLLITDK